MLDKDLKEARGQTWTGESHTQGSEWELGVNEMLGRENLDKKNKGLKI